MQKSQFPELPKIGATIGDSLVLQVSINKYQDLQEGAASVSNALSRVLSEYADLGVGELSINGLAGVVALDGVNEVRNYIKERLIEAEGEIRLGGLRLTPSFISQGLDTGEVEELVRANRRARQAISSTSYWTARKFEIVEGNIQPTESSIHGAVLSSCILSSNPKAKETFSLVKKLAAIQSELNARFSTIYKINLNELIFSNEEGDIVPNGIAIIDRTGGEN